MIPQTIHQIWLGSSVPKKFMEGMADWSLLNPGWHYNLWTAPMPDMVNADLYRNAQDVVKDDAVWQFRADLLRYEILYRYGGFYADTDTKPLRPLGNLLDGKTEWAVAEDDKWVANTYLASKPGSPVFAHLIDSVANVIGDRLSATQASGPQYLTPIWEHHDAYVDYDTDLWFPYSWRHVDNWSFNSVEISESAYAIHEWNHRRDKRKAANRQASADKRAGRI